jgi:hypothetical protein
MSRGARPADLLYTYNNDNNNNNSVGGECEELYFIGVIDISTPWNSRKQAEQMLKGALYLLFLEIKYTHNIYDGVRSAQLA